MNNNEPKITITGLNTPECLNLRGNNTLEIQSIYFNKGENYKNNLFIVFQYKENAGDDDIISSLPLGTLNFMPSNNKSLIIEGLEKVFFNEIFPVIKVVSPIIEIQDPIEITVSYRLN